MDEIRVVDRQLFHNKDGKVIHPESCMSMIIDPDLGNLKDYLLANVEGGGDNSRELLDDNLVSLVKTWSSNKIRKELTDLEIRMIKRLPTTTTIVDNVITTDNGITRVVSEIDDAAGTIIESTYLKSSSEVIERIKTTITNDLVTEEILIQNDYAEILDLPPGMSLDLDSDGEPDTSV